MMLPKKYLSPLAVFSGLLATTFPSWADWEMNMPRGVTAVSQSIHNLHMAIFLICVAIGIVVFGVMFYSIFKHRKSRGAKPEPFHESTTVEILWTTIPFLILVAMAVPATKTLIDLYNTDESEVDIKITGYQWKWQYEYLGEDVSFFSNMATPRAEIYNIRTKNPNYLLEVDNPVVVPVGKKIRFLVTGADVIHSWWVPDLAIKRDAIPGFINEAWTKIDTPGIYRGQCTELCGKDHAYMPVVVDARSEKDYRLWLAEKKQEAERIRELTEKTWNYDELMERGKKTYDLACAQCHQPNGMGMPPVFPALKDAPIAIEKEKIGEHIDIILNGRKGTAMQAFAKQLNDIEIAAVVTYERNAWGNNTGHVVTPQEVMEFRKTGKYIPQESPDIITNSNLSKPLNRRTTNITESNITESQNVSL
ncbi:cytochrome c oxidase subunit 2 [invertebrate metagenome]|uniref:cytochrome-c oxidase n=1 Tax=invertebrate metagenome TaxID=1711999 RepID=A0A2H9T8Q4_9ZZZZ